MAKRRLQNPLAQAICAHEVGQERVRQKSTYGQVHEYSCPPLNAGQLLGRAATFADGAIEQAIDRPKQELHVDRLWTTPTTPDSAEHSSNEKDRYECADHQQGQQQ